MQFGQVKPAVGTVFDCDMGNSIDDALALAMLYGFQGKNETRVLSVSVTKPNLKSAAYCDAVSRFYMGEPGPFGGGNLPVGMAAAGKMPDDTPMLAEPLSRQTPEGKPAYPRSIEKLNQTAEPVALIRNALTSQYDQNAIVVLTGPATNLAALLALPGASALIPKKVRYLVAAAGAFPNGPPETSIASDVAAARKLFAEWPTAIVVSGTEVGDALPFHASSIEKDFAWSQQHPVVDAYRAYKPMPYDAPSWALTAVLYAIRPQENYFKLSEPGTIAI